MIALCLAALLCAEKPEGMPARLAAAMNSHDVEKMLALFDPGYQSTQPLHPERDFTGSEGVRKNWTAIFNDVPDFHAELIASSVTGNTAFTQWRWSGTRKNGSPFSMLGIIVMDIAKGKIAGARVFMESGLPPPPGPPLELSTSELLKQPPQFDYPGIMRGWLMHQGAGATTRLLEINGTINLHYHPATEHRVLMLSGKIRVRVGEEEHLMQPGDFLFVPRQVPHKMWLAEGEKQARCVLVDEPAFDPKATVWIEAAPDAGQRKP
jgi:mannose-6-phosphate isomerase-like protein (cupin superfamily)